MRLLNLFLILAFLTLTSFNAFAVFKGKVIKINPEDKTVVIRPISGVYELNNKSFIYVKTIRLSNNKAILKPILVQVDKVVAKLLKGDLDLISEGDLVSNLLYFNSFKYRTKLLYANNIAAVDVINDLIFDDVLLLECEGTPELVPITDVKSISFEKVGESLKISEVTLSSGKRDCTNLSSLTFLKPIKDKPIKAITTQGETTLNYLDLKQITLIKLIDGGFKRSFFKNRPSVISYNVKSIFRFISPEDVVAQAERIVNKDPTKIELLNKLQKFVQNVKMKLAISKDGANYKYYPMKYSGIDRYYYVILSNFVGSYRYFFRAEVKLTSGIVNIDILDPFNPDVSRDAHNQPVNVISLPVKPKLKRVPEIRYTLQTISQEENLIKEDMRELGLKSTVNIAKTRCVPVTFIFPSLDLVKPALMRLINLELSKQHTNTQLIEKWASILRDFDDEYKPFIKEVYIMGDFNDWQPRQYRLFKDKKGYWKRTIMLGEGEYEYLYVVPIINAKGELVETLLIPDPFAPVKKENKTTTELVSVVKVKLEGRK